MLYKRLYTRLKEVVTWSSTSRESPSKANTSNVMVLDFDVLYLIMVALRSSSRGSLLPLMQTCATLYRAGIPLLLRGPLPIGNSCSDSVLNFLLQDSSRLRYLRDLRVVPFRPPLSNSLETEVWRTQFTQVLAGTVRSLKRLHIECFQKEYHYALLDAADSLLELEELVIDSMDRRVEAMLMNMRSPIRSVSLSHRAGNLAPIPILERFSDTLTTVTLNCPIFTHRGIRFPRVHTLNLRTSCYFENDVEGMYGSFPNVVHLSMHATSAPSVSSVYEVHRQNTDGEHRGWSDLQSLSCSAQYYYAAGLACKAKYWMDANLDSRSITYFHDVLRKVQPSYLQLHFIPRHTTTELLADSLCVANLVHLDLSVEAWLYEQGVQHFLECLATSINSLGPIRFLRLHILYSHAPYILQKEFRTVSLKELSQLLARSNPQLSFISLCLTCNSFEKDQWSYWQVVPGEHGAIVEMLGDGRGDQMEHAIGFR
ncbi:hypothetical protein BXZ70DRAFT_756145 [Cristinia sonorae]|uniref:Uncharacterized protein n=1 Tax=Cristinia sonorae TaxID=1940300 RepID=A0A8K0UT70_9AGAR|nr:hypothetical protein BXZ70DRAFT_756145 [Cristinia sonorae]